MPAKNSTENLPLSTELLFETPMMRQYLELKKRFSDCILFYRLGDFYEMFLEDAKIGSQILDITLTSRDRGKDGRVPMAGVPYHAADAYIAKLVRAGHKVAVCEQLSDPNGPGLVERDVVRIVTPGTVLNDSSLERKENNYICAIHLENDKFGIALCDVSTGTLETDEFDRKSLNEVLINELSKYAIAECILSEEVYNNPQILKILSVHRAMSIFPYFGWDGDLSDYAAKLPEHFKVASLGTFGIIDLIQAQKACSVLLGYINYTQKEKARHINQIRHIKNDTYVSLDRSTLVNLEVFSTIRDGKRQGSLLGFIDNTVTPMGGRLLKHWLAHPVKDMDLLLSRYDIVDYFKSEFPLMEELRNILRQVSDIERVVSRLTVGIGNPRDLLNLKDSLHACEHIKELFENSKSQVVEKLASNIATPALEVSQVIGRIISDTAPLDPKGGGVIKDGVYEELDKLRKRVKSSKDFILKLEIRERKRTGISSLKVRFNQVFGYYIEITRANLGLVPDDYLRKQTLVNAERFITPELKEHEEIILTADEKMNSLEYAKFLDLVEVVLYKTKEIQRTSEVIAQLDCLANFALISHNGTYSRPEIQADGKIDIREGRHPVVENVVGPLNFIPNDTLLDEGDHQLLIITGPNMAGKSVYIRQVAIIVLMAQIGCFVPAKKARISLVDSIFVRSGASDVISMGLSTFMVEMLETAYILNNATSQSLIVMDEIGRGTSTYDGISIAWSVAEHLVKNSRIQPKTLFATHYHELQDLEKEYPARIKNYMVCVDETSEEPIFLHKVQRGSAGHSFGIAVAKLAGIPKTVCERAKIILLELKQRTHGVVPTTSATTSLEAATTTPANTNLASRETQNAVSRYETTKIDLISKTLSEVDISATTPISALNILYDIKRLWEK